jgi:hypothetical protein
VDFSLAWNVGRNPQVVVAPPPFRDRGRRIGLVPQLRIFTADRIATRRQDVLPVFSEVASSPVIAAEKRAGSPTAITMRTTVIDL